jgi:hypothetical protein
LLLRSHQTVIYRIREIVSSMSKRSPSKKAKVPSLVGTWKSDRARTLEFWGFPKKANARARKFLSSRGFFGNLMWRITPTQIHHLWEMSGSSPYRVLWRNEYHAVIQIGRRGSFEVRDIHFDGPDRFYMLAGKANCEFFRRVDAEQWLKRTRESSVLKARANR